MYFTNGICKLMVTVSVRANSTRPLSTKVVYPFQVLLMVPSLGSSME